MSPFDLQLLTVVAEPKARKAVAKKIGLPSGVVPVLAAVGFWSNQGSFAHARHLYAAEMGAATLIRHYVAQLVRAALVERIAHNQRLLRLTPKGREALWQYERELKQGVEAYGYQRPQRVLTHCVKL